MRSLALEKCHGSRMTFYGMGITAQALFARAPDILSDDTIIEKPGTDYKGFFTIFVPPSVGK